MKGLKSSSACYINFSFSWPRVTSSMRNLSCAIESLDIIKACPPDLNTLRNEHGCMCLFVQMEYNEPACTTKLGSIACTSAMCMSCVLAAHEEQTPRADECACFAIAAPASRASPCSK